MPAADQTAMVAELLYTNLRAAFSHLAMAEGLGPLIATIPERSPSRPERMYAPHRASRGEHSAHERAAAVALIHAYLPAR